MVNSVRNDLPYVLWEIEAVLDCGVRQAQPMTSTSSTEDTADEWPGLPPYSPLCVSLPSLPLFSFPPPLKDHNRVKHLVWIAQVDQKRTLESLCIIFFYASFSSEEIKKIMETKDFPVHLWSVLKFKHRLCSTWVFFRSALLEVHAVCSSLLPFIA